MSFPKISDSKKRILEYLILALILILATVLNCYRIAEPAWDAPHTTNYEGAVDGWHGLNLCEWGGVARNYAKFGYLKAGTKQVAYYRRWADLSRFHHRVDQPPLLPLLISLSFRLFGVHEWSARLVPLLSSIGLVLLVFWLGRKLGGAKVAVTASFIFILLPVQVCYSTLLEPHSLGFFFSLLTFVFYLQWLEKRKRGYCAGIYVSFILGALSGWIAYFVVPAILLHYLVCGYKEARSLIFVLSFALMPLVLLGTHLGWTYMLGGKWALEGLLDRFLIRTVSGGSTEGKILFTMWDFYARGYIRAKLFLTPIVCFLSAAWFIGFVITPLRRKLPTPSAVSPELNSGQTRRVIPRSSFCNSLNCHLFPRRDMFVLAIFLFSLSHNLVLSNHAHMHDMIMFLHLTPFFAISAALGAQFIAQKILWNKWIWTAPFVLIVGYLFITQSTSALEWLFDVPVLPETYIVGSRVNEITDESANVLSSFEPDYRMRYYADREWSVVEDFNDLKSLMQADPTYSHYILEEGSGDEELKKYLVRNHPVENLYNYSLFNLQALGSNVTVSNPQIRHPAEINFDDKLMFLGYNVEEVIQKKKEPAWLEKYLKGHAEFLPVHRTFFHITYFWRCLEEVERDYTLITQFEGHHGQTYRLDQSHQGVNGAYPTSMWQVGEIIREEYQVEVPADYPPIRYALRVGVRDGEEGLKVVSDVETDEEDRVRFGEIEVLPAEEPSPLTAEPHPQNRIEANINDEFMFLGYDLNDRNPEPGDQLRVTTYWQSLRKTEQDYAIQVELRNGGYKVREMLDIAPTRLWEEGRYYQGDVVLAINPHLLEGTYSLELGLERDDGTATQITLASLEIPGQRRHILKRMGKANYGESSEIISPDEPLPLRLHLKEAEPLELVAGWTGKSEFEETRVEVYITNAYWRERYLGTWVVESGDYQVTKRKIGKAFIAPGENVIELRVSEVPERVHNVGWRGWMDRVFPDLLQDPRTDYDGPIQMDFAQVSSRWEGNWGDHYDLARAYAERAMMGEVARLYEETVEKGVEPEWVDDLALFKRAYAALGEQGKVGEIEERIAGRITHKININLGGKVEFLGYSLRGEERGDHRLSLFFRCLQDMAEDYTLWVHGEVEDESLLEGMKSERGYAVFDHLLPTSRWEAGEVYQDDEVKGLRPGRYHFTLGLWRPEDGSRLWREDDPNAHIIDLGWVEMQ
jgi:hypothetical protein